MKANKIFLLLSISFILSFQIVDAQWIQTSLKSGPIYSLTVFGSNLFAGTTGSILLSTNNGKNWNKVMDLNSSSSDYNETVKAFAVSGSNLFAGIAYEHLNTQSGVVLRSTDNGTSWTVSTVDRAFVYALAVSDSNLFAGTDGGVFLSTNNGTSWTWVSTGLHNAYSINSLNVNVTSLAVSGTNLFAGTWYGVFLSTNNGTSWTAVNTGLTNTVVSALTVSGKNLFVGTGGGVFLSTNNGTSWNEANYGIIGSLVVDAFSVSGTNIFAGNSCGVFLSTNNGASWAAVNTGLPSGIAYPLSSATVYSLIVFGTNLYAATSNGVWMRPLSQMTSVEEFSTDLPTRFSLDQNFPNPFNPSTTVRYELPSRSTVNLVIYNVLGQVVKELINTEQQAGFQSVVWNATVSSGLYFYRLDATSKDNPSKRFVETKKMLLLK